MASNNGAIGHMQKSFERLEEADILYANQKYDGAVGCAYYGVFHAVKAVLAADSVTEYSQHKSVLGYFNKHYVNTGLVGSISARVLKDLFDLRNDSEYNPTIFIDPEGAAEAIKQAKAAVAYIVDYFNAKGCFRFAAESGFDDDDKGAQI